MISDDDVIRLFQRPHRFLTKELIQKKSFPNALFRGKPWNRWDKQHPKGCQRYLAVFDKFNIISRYCFDCYKVQAEPRTVM